MLKVYSRSREGTLMPSAQGNKAICKMEYEGIMMGLQNPSIRVPGYFLGGWHLEGWAP